MFFKTKKKNRRLDHDFVLDVKLGSSQVRAARWRLTISIFAITALALSLLLGVWRGGQWMVDRLIYSNSSFAIQQIEIQTDGVLVTDQLRRWTQARPGENLLALDMGKVKRDLEMVPYIEAVNIERILPHTLKVRIFEREPIAQACTTDIRATDGVTQRVFHMDESGRVMTPLDPRLRSAPPLVPLDQLPMLAGMNPTDLISGRQIDSPIVLAALGFIAQFNRSPMAALVDLQSIDISSPGLLSVHTRQGSDIGFATQDYETQLRRWQQIFDLYARSGKIITTLDLSISNNIPLRWAEATGTPAALPKPVKTSHHGRKNV